MVTLVPVQLQTGINELHIRPFFYSESTFLRVNSNAKNYIECFNLKEKGDEYYIYKENNTYPIVDDNLGTTVYSGHILNGILEYLELKKINIDYVVLNSFHIQLDTFKKILEELSHLTEENKNNIFQNVNMLCKDNVDKGFFYTETVYKVKGGNK